MRDIKTDPARNGISDRLRVRRSVHRAEISGDKATARFWGDIQAYLVMEEFLNGSAEIIDEL